MTLEPRETTGATDGLTDTPTARRFSVTGRVQGVAYRASCRSRAQELGVTGWARNEADGSVTVHAQGSAQAVEALHEWCCSGPSHARVEHVTAEDVAVDEALSGFTTA